MEHQHDSYTQTQQQTPLGDHSTNTHHDKKLESPTCTDFTNNHLENLQLESTMDTYQDGTYSYQEAATLASTDDRTTLDQPYESIGDDVSMPMDRPATHSEQGPGDIDETVDPAILESATELGTTVDHHVVDTTDSTIMAADNTQQDVPPNDKTLPTETGSSNDGVDTDNTHSSLASEDQHKVTIETAAPLDDNDLPPGDTIHSETGIQETVDQLDTNMTSDDDKGEDDNNSITNPSVDHISSCDRANSPSAMDRSTDTSSLSTNQQLDPTQSQQHPEVSPSTSHHAPDSMETNGENDQVERVINDQQEATQSIPTTSDAHQLDRTNTTGSDEHTLSEAPRPRRVWESDRQASECRRCSRRFSFLVRRHHCRRCGQVVCDRCSSHRVRLPVEELVEDPLISTSFYPMIAQEPQRVCESCIRIPIKASEPSSRYAFSSNSNYQAGHSTLGHLRPMNMERTNSQQSLMADCPVCGTGLLGMGKQQQEHHLNQCLNAGSPTVNPPRYIVYTLTEGTAQLGDECPICFEEFQVGDKIARMVCLCSYHRHCLRDWLERGKGCPIHYDSNFGAY